MIAVIVVVVFCVVRRCKKNQQDGTTTEDKSQVSEGKSKESVKTAGQKTADQKKGQKKGIKGDVCGDVQPKTVVPKEDDDKTQKTDLVSLVGFLRFWQF